MQAALGVLSLIGLARAEAPASPPMVLSKVLDAAAVPFLPPQGRQDYRRFLLQATPRAFAVATDGNWAWASAVGTPAETVERALSLCATYTSAPCRLYARDLDVVWPGQATHTPRAPERPVQGGPGWSLVPDGRFFWQGPAQARGAYVWAHGRAAGGQDSRGSQPQPHVRVFNNAGYDVLRFDRAPDTDETEDAAAWLHRALLTLRAQGYKRVVIGGQSRGAWNALEALDTPGLVDGVVAIAPAAHGPTGSPAWAWALEDLLHVVSAARSPAARVVVANFTHDEFDPDPVRRSALFRSLGSPRVGALLFIDRPSGIQGHGGGAEPLFNQRYGQCLLDFVERRVNRCD